MSEHVGSYLLFAVSLEEMHLGRLLLMMTAGAGF